MVNDNIGQKRTFFKLLDEVASIKIPKVQRDYAYGREEQKVQTILDGMLTSIITAVRDDTSNILDFVYGGSDVHDNNQKGGHAYENCIRNCLHSYVHIINIIFT